ncbi:MAG: hypothetical protein QW251_05180 [Desulfurococcaceae archaeon]
MADTDKTIGKVLYLIALTLYLPKEFIPYDKDLGCSIYDNIGDIYITETFLKDMKKVAEFFGLEDTYDVAISMIERVTVEDIIKYRLPNNEIAFIKSDEFTDYSSFLSYERGLLVTIDLYSGDYINIIL